MLLFLNDKWQVISIKAKKAFGLLFPIACCLAVVACGFQPVYGTSSALCAHAPLLAGIVVSATDGESPLSASGSVAPTSASRQFRENLEDLLAPASNGKPSEYKLDISLNQVTTAIGISRDGTASRYNLTINSSYKLSRISDNKTIDSGSVSNVTGYNNPSNAYFSTYISEQDARKRGVAELAELYRQRLTAITENSVPPKEKPPIPPSYENCPKVN